MARDIDIRVDGLRDFRRDMRRLAPEADKALLGELRDAAGKIAAQAASAAPHRTGALARSVRPYVSGHRISIGSRLPYAGVVHWGGTISPRGVKIRFPRTEFVSKAIDRGTDRLVEDIGDAVERAAGRAGWR